LHPADLDELDSVEPDSRERDPMTVIPTEAIPPIAIPMVAIPASAISMVVSPANDVELDRVEADFAELICGDEEWVRAEFDAIVAAEWGTPPPAPPPAPPGRDDRPPAWPGPDAPEPVSCRLAAAALVRKPGRHPQRSPPAA
jgi:hypothetical protein